jgi:hypothetical protein
MDKTKGKRGFVLVLTLFLTLFCMGVFMLNHKMTGARSARIRSGTDVRPEKDAMAAVQTLVFHELAGVEASAREGIYTDFVDHFTKNPEDRFLWEEDSTLGALKQSKGGYRIASITTSGKTIYAEDAPDSAKAAIMAVLNKGKGGKFTLIFAKTQTFSGSARAVELAWNFSLTLEYANGNKDLSAPDGKSIKELEVDARDL